MFNNVVENLKSITLIGFSSISITSLSSFFLNSKFRNKNMRTQGLVSIWRDAVLNCLKYLHKMYICTETEANGLISKRKKIKKYYVLIPNNALEQEQADFRHCRSSRR